MTPSPNQYASSRCGWPERMKSSNPSVVVLGDALGDLVVAADERRAGAPPARARTRPRGWGRSSGPRGCLRAAPHPLLADRLGASRASPGRRRPATGPWRRAAGRRRPRRRPRCRARSRAAGCRTQRPALAAAASARHLRHLLRGQRPAARPRSGRRRRGGRRPARPPDRWRRRRRSPGAAAAARGPWRRPPGSARPRSRTASPLHAPRSTVRNSSVRAYRPSWSSQSPKRRCLVGLAAGHDVEQQAPVGLSAGRSPPSAPRASA